MSNKPLSEYTLEELWQLFPIELQEYSANYDKQYSKESGMLTSILGETVIRLSHIGSTAVKDLLAKPIVDILLEIPIDTDINWLIQKLSHNGWLLMSKEITPTLKLSFNKGYTEQGFAEEVFHLHVRQQGDWGELYFRDYLIEYPDIAQEYARLKLKLMEEYKYNRDAYTDAKTKFINNYTKLARKEYLNRYSG